MKFSVGRCLGLLFFDLVGLTIAGYSFLLVYQLFRELPSANVYLILVGLFMAVKVSILSLYDLNRDFMAKNVPFIAGFISIFGNMLLFVVCYFFMPSVTWEFSLGLAVVDFLMVILSHLLWWGFVGRREPSVKAGLEEKKANRRKKVQTKRATESEKAEEYETGNMKDLKQDSDAAMDGESPMVNQNDSDTLKTNLEKEVLLLDSQSPLTSSQKAQPILEPADLTSLNEEEFAQQRENEAQLLSEEERFERLETLVKEIKHVQADMLDSENQDQTDDGLQAFQMESASIQIDDFFKERPKSKKPRLFYDELDNLGQSTRQTEKVSLVNEDGANSIERRLEYVLQEIDNSLKETQDIQESVNRFQQELEGCEPVTRDANIMAAGNLIREKLKMVIDKQATIDEVLDDLMRLSKLLNKRVSDLDVIETKLNQRKIAIDHKDLLAAKKLK